MRLLTLTTLVVAASAVFAADDEQWIQVGKDNKGGRYAEAAQITPDNVDQLEQVWSYRTGDVNRPKEQVEFSGHHATPILLPKAAGQHLVLCSAFNKIIALDPVTGAERWLHDPEIAIGPPGTQYKCRGVAYWEDTQAKADAVCKHRIIANTNDRRIIALDARDGKPCKDFGTDPAKPGEINIEPLIAAKAPAPSITNVQTYTPPVVVSDTIVIGSTTNSKSRMASAPNGAIRAFDARTGEFKWDFDPIPRDPEDPQHKNWTPEALQLTGAGNAWSFLSVDQERDLVFIPTSSASPDFFGGLRPGDNRHASSVVALRGSTGELVWSFQTVHHDVWNFDNPAQPMLLDIKKDGKKIPVVVQLTKMGLVFVLHRETGEPVFGVEERAVPTDGVAGEKLSPTQPFPLAPPPLVPQSISADDAWGFTFYDEGKCREQIAALRGGSIYTPISEQGTALYPQTGGGVNWGGGAFDPERNLLITNVMRVPYFLKLVPVADLDPQRPFNPRAGTAFGPPGEIDGTPYAIQQGPLLSPFMSPCTEPPWGSLVAVDLGKGTIEWETALGTLEKLMPIPLPLKLGTPSAGGPMVTKTGLIFIGATMDEKFRAFDIETGEELWKATLPTAGMANPMSYEIDGRQFVVISAGGHFFLYRRNMGDHVVAFALPKK